ncbi:hypothetical protein HPP92_021468 [Vanilla planifolia]|uniref:Matrin-type domain-containing protein n=1 Tax=Vanilla planifolia TaxID=51239 RepID=A0A835UJ02_VANPL|nr:hypothetical protein HPP92_021468 [Vanilla planifolia]
MEDDNSSVHFKFFIPQLIEIFFSIHRYYCDYCDTYLTHDSPSVRKQHNAGYKHKANVRSYYQQFEEQQTQSLIDQRIKSILANRSFSTTSLTVNRKVTNVGNAQETYQANIVEPAGVRMYLSTYKLQFSRYRQQESFDITFVSKGKPLPGTDPTARGKIVWDSGVHLVTSPIAARLF